MSPQNAWIVAFITTPITFICCFTFWMCPQRTKYGAIIITMVTLWFVFPCILKVSSDGLPSPRTAAPSLSTFIHQLLQHPIHPILLIPVQLPIQLLGHPLHYISIYSSIASFTSISFSTSSLAFSSTFVQLFPIKTLPFIQICLVSVDCVLYDFVGWASNQEAQVDLDLGTKDISDPEARWAQVNSNSSFIRIFSQFIWKIKWGKQWFAILTTETHYAETPKIPKRPIDAVYETQKTCWTGRPIIHLWDLSLIHIWRCRRLLTCRSRWSPYH